MFPALERTWLKSNSAPGRRSGLVGGSPHGENRQAAGDHEHRRRPGAGRTADPDRARLPGRTRGGDRGYRLDATVTGVIRGRQVTVTVQIGNVP